LTAFIDRPAENFDETVRFWMSVTGSSISPTRGEHDEFATLIPPDGDPYLRVQRVGDGPGGSHLDVHVDDIPSSTARAIELGAEVRTELDDVTVFSSPGGIAFCVVAHREEGTRPSPVVVGDAPRSLADQLCLDLAPDHYDDDCAFWAAFTGWDHRTARLKEFSYLERPDDIPLRLLFQRADDPHHVAAAHLDIACDSVEMTTDAHERIGATVFHRYKYWTTLLDPTGLPYCLTSRNPDSGVLPPE
jgi:hypothetical protein